MNYNKKLWLHYWINWFNWCKCSQAEACILTPYRWVCASNKCLRMLFYFFGCCCSFCYHLLCYCVFLSNVLFSFVSRSSGCTLHTLLRWSCIGGVSSRAPTNRVVCVCVPSCRHHCHHLLSALSYFTHTVHCFSISNRLERWKAAPFVNIYCNNIYLSRKEYTIVYIEIYIQRDRVLSGVHTVTQQWYCFWSFSSYIRFVCAWHTASL